MQAPTAPAPSSQERTAPPAPRIIVRLTGEGGKWKVQGGGKRKRGADDSPPALATACGPSLSRRRLVVRQMGQHSGLADRPLAHSIAAEPAPATAMECEATSHSDADDGEYVPAKRVRTCAGKGAGPSATAKARHASITVRPSIACTSASLPVSHAQQGGVMMWVAGKGVGPGDAAGPSGAVTKRRVAQAEDC